MGRLIISCLSFLGHSDSARFGTRGRRRRAFIFDAGDDDDRLPEYRLWEALMRHRHVDILTLIRSSINRNTNEMHRRSRYNSSTFLVFFNQRCFENFRSVLYMYNLFVNVHTRSKISRKKCLLDKLKIPRFCLPSRVLRKLEVIVELGESYYLSSFYKNL